MFILYIYIYILFFLLVYFWKLFIIFLFYKDVYICILFCTWYAHVDELRSHGFKLTRNFRWIAWTFLFKSEMDIQVLARTLCLVVGHSYDKHVAVRRPDNRNSIQGYSDMGWYGDGSKPFKTYMNFHIWLSRYFHCGDVGIRWGWWIACSTSWPSTLAPEAFGQSLAGDSMVES